MNTALLIAGSIGLGIVLGWIVFGGLWATVNGLVGKPHPARRLLLSFVLRMTLVLAGFLLLVTVGGWTYCLAALLGLTLSRGWWLSQRLASPAAADAQ
ncbi:MAG: hypothetical protein KDI09_03935 [Halioglobus sp.]|nr:hypothetical protein [Halioglobus sp.]